MQKEHKENATNLCERERVDLARRTRSLKCKFQTFGKTYTNNNPLAIRKLTDNKWIANGFSNSLMVCPNTLTE